LALRFLQFNESGFPGIIEYTNDPDGGVVAPPSRIKAVYEYGDVFSVDLKFDDYEDMGEFAPPTIRSVVIDIISFVPQASGITCVKISADTVRISGSAQSAFTDSFYQFIMRDKTLKILPVDTTEDYLAIVRWSPPSIKSIDTISNLTLKVDNLTEETIPISQLVQWYYPKAVQGFRNALAKGKA
jgi:hypothetical protein